MRRITQFLLVTCFSVTGFSPLWSQACPPNVNVPIVFDEREIKAIPVGGDKTFDQLEFTGLGDAAEVPSGIAGRHRLPWTLKTDEIRFLASLKPTPTAVFTSSADDQLKCERTGVGFTPQAVPDGPNGSAGPTPKASEGQVQDVTDAAHWSIIPLENGDCVTAGAVFSHKIAREQSGAFTALIFDPNTRDVCYRSTDRPAFGAPIHVAILTNEPSRWANSKLTYSPCSLEESKPSLFVPENLPTIPSGLQARTAWVLRRFQARRCFDPSVAVTVERTQMAGSEDAPVVMRAEISQARRYHAALQAGVVFTNVHDHDFGLAKDGDTIRVLDKGPVRNGPEYVASLVVYSLLRQLGSLAGGSRYPGRDLVSDNRIEDRISGVLGVGLNKPGERFVAGIGYEVVTGVNATVTWNWARVRRLADGTESGDRFTGTENQIPIRREWKQDVAFGISFDLTYATKLLNR
jgi:hypothetical protein